MSSAQREYPETKAGPFPRPPEDFTDREDRTIEITLASEVPVERIVDMYADFDPAQRAQGIPPSDPERIEPWIKTVIEEGVHIAASHDSRVVGHAMLVPDGDDAYELAIFVHQEYQQAGIGRSLIEHLLGAGLSAGVERIWLTVERWNVPAIELYRSVGFETVLADRFDIEMAMKLTETSS